MTKCLPACLCLLSSITNSLINHWKCLKRQLWSSVSALPWKLRRPPVEKKKEKSKITPPHWWAEQKVISLWTKNVHLSSQAMFCGLKNMSSNMPSPLCELSCCPDPGMCWGKGQIKHAGQSRPGFGRYLHWPPIPEDLQKLPKDA